jgi:integrase/recombinase XerC
MTTELEPVPSSALDRLADQRELLRRRAEELAVRWLHGYTNSSTRNGYAFDIGLSPELRAALPGGPGKPHPAPGWAWIPWALDHNLNPAGNLRREDAEAYAHILQDAPKKTRQRRWSALCAYYRYLRVEGIVSCDPGEMVNRRVMGLSGSDPSTTLAPAAAQVRALYLAAGLSKRQRERNQAMLAVLAATGCRAAELVALDLGDYRPHPDGHAKLRLHGKGGKERWALLPAPDTALVEAYLETRVARLTSGTVARVGDVSHGPAQPLFTTSKGRRYHVDNVPRMLRTIARQARPGHPDAAVRDAARVLAPIVDSIHPHQLRHAYAVTAEQAGVPVSQIQRDLGHRSLSTTQTYLHAGEVERSAARVVSGIYHAGQA